MVTGGSSVSAVVAAGPMAAGPMAAGPTAAPTVPTGTDTALPTQRRPGENRRSNKPIMEKRRRARINNCLNELKTLLLESMKKDPARHSKLEKADILEMTVKHLQMLQRQHAAMSAASDPTVVNQYHAGFNDCLAEVKRYRELDATSRRRLVQHLITYFEGAAAEGSASNDSPAPASSPTPSPQQAQAAVQVHILQSGTGTHALPALAAAPNGGIFLTTNGPGPGLQLVPTRLPNGDIAFILPSAPAAFRQAPPTVSSSPSASPVPSSSSSASSPLPMLVPVPTRTASTASASSTSSASSSSPMTFDRLSVASPPDAVATPGPALRDAATSPASAMAPTSMTPMTAPQSAVAATMYRAPPSPSYKRAHSRSPSPYHVPVRPYSPPMQGPLSLVIRKTEAPEGKPWRPW